MNEDLAKVERDKYELMWQQDEYRHYAPGEPLVDQAMAELGIEKGDTLIDFGCGTGRPAQRFADRGVVVTAIDHVHNCLDAHVKVSFVKACLWSIPEEIQAQHGFCTDVMEHIPPEMVFDVLESIHSRTDDAFFQINTLPDKMGLLIGQPLHLTLKRSPWWKGAMGAFWSDVQVLRDDPHNLVIVCR